jgi:hypothetical protein
MRYNSEEKIFITKKHTFWVVQHLFKEFGEVNSKIEEDLNLKPYKLPQYHELKPSDPAKRLDFCIWFMGLPKTTTMRLICSDEAYFCLTEPVVKMAWSCCEP